MWIQGYSSLPFLNIYVVPVSADKGLACSAPEVTAFQWGAKLKVLMKQTAFPLTCPASTSTLVEEAVGASIMP